MAAFGMGSSTWTRRRRRFSSSSSSSPMFWTTFILSFALLLSLPLLFLLAPHFFPPTNRVPIPAADEIDDQALFARAVRSKSASTPSLYNIYVHTDPSINVTIPPGVFLHRFISSKRTYHASPTLISATRRLLVTAVLDDRTNAFFTVVSQYCVSIHSFRYVYHSLFASPTYDKSDSDSNSDSDSS